MPDSIEGKVLLGLERIADAFKALLWQKAKVYGISPIQIQILLFVSGHKSDMCSVSQLALEFNVSRPTISDAVRILHRKSLVTKVFDPDDGRRYYLELSEGGRKLVSDLASYSLPIATQVRALEDGSLENLYASVTQLIFQLNRSGILSTQRMCFGCKFYAEKSGGHYCRLLENPLRVPEIRLDCPEFESQ